jgi:predicted nucleic acid-binding protein
MQEFFTNNNWIEIVQIQNTDAKKTFTSSLHSGEVETILLAMEKSADLCIFDDLLARKHAKRLNLNLTGTLGVIIAAKQTGLIDSVKPLLDKLIAVDMYISDKLYNTVLSQARE